MVSGKATAAELGKKFEQIGDIAPMLQQLVAQGFIEVAGASPQPAAAAASASASTAAPSGGPEQLKQAQTVLCMHLRNVLGPAADALTEKIEACKSMADLRSYFAKNRDMLDDWLGKTKGAQFWAKADPLLK